MPGNLRRKLKRGSGPTERQYLKVREQIIRESQICAGCHDAIDLTLKPICVQVKTAGFTVENAHDIPVECEPGCGHARKANPWSASADHIIPVEKLPPGSPLLVSKKNLCVMHKVCNQRKGSGAAVDRPKFVSSGDWS